MQRSSPSASVAALGFLAPGGIDHFDVALPSPPLTYSPLRLEVGALEVGP